MTGIMYYKGKKGGRFETHTWGGRLCGDRGRDWRDVATSQGTLEQPEAGRGAGRGLPQSLQAESSLPSLQFQSSKVPVVSHPVWGSLFCWPLGC